MSAHTPGPWEVESGCRTVRATSLPLTAGTGLAPPAVAVTVRSVEGLADARLIAAAPDLADALDALVRFIYAQARAGCGLPQSWEPPMKEARAALRKAGRLP